MMKSNLKRLFFYSLLGLNSLIVTNVIYGANNPTTRPSSPPNQGSGREEIAYNEAPDPSWYSKDYNRGSWDYREKWRYNRDAFLSGENQNDYNIQFFPYDRDYRDDYSYHYDPELYERPYNNTQRNAQYNAQYNGNGRANGEAPNRQANYYNNGYNQQTAPFPRPYVDNRRY